MAKVRRINVSQIEGNSSNENNNSEIRPFGELGVYVNEDEPDQPELLIFDGIRTHIKSKVLAPGIFYGSNADSGDGLGLDTIKLIPDAELFRNNGNYDNDQYIIVDPTEPDHIHLRAGGTIDDSSADLFLGGEENHIRVSDGSKRVTIKTTSYSDDQSTWIFDPLLTGEGTQPAKIIFPDGTEQITAWAGGRVVDVPDSSVGAEGDKAGDISFSPGHLYYCFEDYNSGVSYNTTLSNITEDDNKFIFGKDEGVLEPLIGWSITVDLDGENEETNTITNVEDLATDWRVTWSGGNVTFNPGTAIRIFSTNIWKRVAWSNDIW
jgi:hypothetical protein